MFGLRKVDYSFILVLIRNRCFVPLFPLQPSFQRKQFNGSADSPTPYSNYSSATSTLNRPGGNQMQSGGNMTELDHLLQDLKSSKYGQSLERKHNINGECP